MAMRQILGMALLASLVVLSAVANLAVGQAACEEGGGHELYVVCMTTVLASIVEQIGGPYVSVEAIVPPGFCPGHYDVRPSDVEAIREADLIIGHIAVFPWVEDLFEAAGRPIEDLHMISGPWNTPTSAISYVSAITALLCEHATNSTMGDYFTTMNATLCSELLSLADELQGKASELGVSDVKVICMEWQVSFVSWLGFNITATFPPQERMSAADVEALVELGREEGVAIVIDNLQSGTEVGTEIAREIGAEHVVLTNFPGAVPGTNTLADMIRYNAEQLFNATSRWKALSGELRELRGQLEALKGENMLLWGATAVLAIIAITEGIVIAMWRRKP
ncbi:MAG TPA: zinc ABC transporter substrate-binding protein [Candidatus Bathyarchaeota archaeon]|nr:zinc ABC transporter substrate-binding protein [Candidatus Bathyarchaeota archaeon]